MDTVEKLRTINYICDTCKHCGILGLLCVDPKREKDEEDRFASCEYLRKRVDRIDEALNRTLYAEEIAKMRKLHETD